MKARAKKKAVKTSVKNQWRVARIGVRFTVKRGRLAARWEDGSVRTFRTRGAAARVARQLNRR